MKEQKENLDVDFWVNSHCTFLHSIILSFSCLNFLCFFFLHLKIDNIHVAQNLKISKMFGKNVLPVPGHQLPYFFPHRQVAVGGSCIYFQRIFMHI